VSVAGRRGGDDFPPQQRFTGDEGEAEYLRAVLARATRVSSPVVVTLPHPPAESVRRMLPGTIVFFVATRGSSLFNRLREAALAHDYEMLDLLSDRIGFELARAFLIPVHQEEAAASGLSAVPSLAEFRYGHKLLIRGLFPLATWEVAEAAILWTGGALVDDRFACVEYVTSPEAPELESLVLKVPPRLTAVERAVINQVPDDLSELHLRGSSALFTDVLVRVVGDVAGAVLDFVRNLFAPHATAGEITLTAHIAFVYAPIHIAATGGGLLPQSVREKLQRLSQEAGLDPARLGGSIDRLLDLREELIAGRLFSE